MNTGTLVTLGAATAGYWYITHYGPSGASFDASGNQISPTYWDTWFGHGQNVAAVPGGALQTTQQQQSAVYFAPSTQQQSIQQGYVPPTPVYQQLNNGNTATVVNTNPCFDVYGNALPPEVPCIAGTKWTPQNAPTLELQDVGGHAEFFTSDKGDWVIVINGGIPNAPLYSSPGSGSIGSTDGSGNWTMSGKGQVYQPVYMQFPASVGHVDQEAGYVQDPNAPQGMRNVLVILAATGDQGVSGLGQIIRVPAGAWGALNR